MEATDFSGLVARAVAGLEDVRGCLLVSRDGLTLGAYPQGGEERARHAWDRLESVGEPERGFLVVADEVWVFARRGPYACIVVATAGAKAGLLLDRMESMLRSAEESRLQAGSAPAARPEAVRRPRTPLHREPRMEPRPPVEPVFEQIVQLAASEQTTASAEAPAPPAEAPFVPPVSLEPPAEAPTAETTPEAETPVAEAPEPIAPIEASLAPPVAPPPPVVVPEPAPPSTPVDPSGNGHSPPAADFEPPRLARPHTPEPPVPAAYEPPTSLLGEMDLIPDAPVENLGEMDLVSDAPAEPLREPESTPEPTPDPTAMLMPEPEPLSGLAFDPFSEPVPLPEPPAPDVPDAVSLTAPAPLGLPQLPDLGKVQEPPAQATPESAKEETEVDAVALAREFAQLFDEPGSQDGI